MIILVEAGWIANTAPAVGAGVQLTLYFQTITMMLIESFPGGYAHSMIISGTGWMFPINTGLLSDEEPDIGSMSSALANSNFPTGRFQTIRDAIKANICAPTQAHVQIT